MPRSKLLAAACSGSACSAFADALAGRDVTEPIAVPYTTLSDEALTRLIEEFVTRSGTDYGAEEASVARRIADVRRQLLRGEAAILFDPDTQTANIVPNDRR